MYISDSSRGTESAKKLIRQLIAMDWRRIERDVGAGTCDRLVKLFDEYFDAIEEDDNYETSWNYDLAKNNLYEELFKGIRLTS